MYLGQEPSVEKLSLLVTGWKLAKNSHFFDCHDFSVWFTKEFNLYEGSDVRHHGLIVDYMYYRDCRLVLEIFLIISKNT